MTAGEILFGVGSVLIAVGFLAIALNSFVRNDIVFKIENIFIIFGIACLFISLAFYVFQYGFDFA